MSLPSYLSKIKSAGIYRFVFDKSEVPGEEAETMRLVVGYSEKGPFNTLLYIEKASEFETIFGGINKKLERRGCYFHRLALQALSAGPILVINLKPFDTDSEHPEKVAASSFNVSDTVTSKLKTLGIEDIYDTTRFWHLEPEGLGQRFAKVNKTGEKYITITAADSSETTNSVFVRGYKPTGYDVSFKEWYSSVLNGEELPSYLEGHEMDRLSEYFAEVYVFRGKFTPEIATSEALSKYFTVDTTGETPVVYLKPYIENAFGEKQDTLAALAADSNSNFVSSYSGILLPNFQSPNGSYISLDLLFNSDNDIHKMMMNLNIDSLYDGTIPVEGLNTTGWAEVGKALNGGTAIGSVTLRELSANGVTPVVCHATHTASDGWTYGDASPATYADPDFYAFGVDGTTYGDYTITGGPELAEIGSVGDKFILKTDDSNDSDVTVLTKIEESNTEYTSAMPADNTEVTDAVRGKFTKVPYVKQPYSVKVNLTDTGLKGLNLNAPTGATATNTKVSIITGTTPTAKAIALEADGTTGVKATTAALSDYASLAVGEYEFLIYTETAGDYKLILSSGATPTAQDPVDITFNPAQKKIVLTFDKKLDNAPLYNTEIIRCNAPVLATCQNLTPTAFDGYTYGLKLPSSDMMDKLNWQKAVLDTLTKYEGIRLALTNRTDSEYHYLVDTFESFVDTELKSTFGVIAKEKDNCLALVNFPAIKTFKDCKYTSFTDSNGKFQTKYIADGCNKQKPAAKLFTLMSEFNGASFVSYNTPVVLSDGTLKTYCPSAALVSNDFMAKYVNRLPYSIVAGPSYGRIIWTGLVGPDFNFSRSDLDVLEPMGVNCMVYVPRKGTYINSNQTAKQNPVTALSKINVRELVIFLQDEIENLLQNYQWEYNTSELRDTIKSKADTICETVKLNGGLYEYLNVCDESNNTPEVIDNEMIILDTSIEPGRGAGKMVQRLYIYKTGGLKAIMS